VVSKVTLLRHTAVAMFGIWRTW